MFSRKEGRNFENGRGQGSIPVHGLRPNVQFSTDVGLIPYKLRRACLGGDVPSELAGVDVTKKVAEILRESSGRQNQTPEIDG
jgi:hypothetical protein